MVQTASYPSLDARVALVTGGGSGIGASIVEHLCAQRARVAFVDIDRSASEALVPSAVRAVPRSTVSLRTAATIRAPVAPLVTPSSAR